MKYELFDKLEAAILTDDIDLKERIITESLRYCNSKDIKQSDAPPPKHFTQPSYASKCQIVTPRALPARNDFESKEGLATLVHAIVHIEYSAIDLALDAVYRYRDVTSDYRIDWLEVASDEVRHFKMLADLLKTLGFSYADFPVHSGLFDAACHTAHSHIERMAVIPRYYEASGLDVGPRIIKKLHTRRKNPFISKLLYLLDLIYEEEIVHVQKGDKWFKYLCNQQGESTDIYFDILHAYGLLEKHRPNLNVHGRKAAGFSCEEIKRLGAKTCA